MKTGRPTDRIAEATPESRRFPANMSFNGKDDYRLSAESLPTPEAGTSRHGRLQLLELIDQLGERDFEILISLKSAKYLLTGQVKRLHFTDASSDTAAMRAAVRAMRKLERYGLVKTFKRRIGGLRAGSGSLVWCLTESGQRLLNLRDHTEQSRRSHRYLEPSYVHLRHTLAIAECYVQLVELSRIHKKIVLASVEWEPESWRPYTHNGHSLQLKPDLFAVTYNGGYEDRWFIEIDLNTEALPVVIDILIYREDIGTLQDIVRRLRKAGGMTNDSCGIHIHLDGAAHTPRSIRNFINLIASRNDLFYKALQIEPERMGYCKKMDAYLVKRMNEKKPRTFSQLEEIWYAGYGGNRNGHYHDSRYHFLNLHCFFHGNHTIELRGFNSELHAGKIRAYIVFALAMNHQALTQKSASYRKVQEENEKFAMRVYLNRIGFIGEEFKSCRKHLYEHLDGNAAWRYGSKENCRSRRKKPKNVVDEEEASLNESESDDLDYLCDPNADLPFD